MRTTLKRGLARGGAGGGSTYPPGAPSPITVYRQPESAPRSRAALIGRVAMWLGVVALVFVSGAAGGAYLYFHQSVAAVAADTPEVKRAAKKLAVPLPGQPALALVIGYDHRPSEGDTSPSRSDTLMLVRADPATDSISLLSFPRDMQVEIRCPGKTPFYDKLAHAYAYCGPQGSLETVKSLTGVAINYLITVDFKGFQEIVDRLGGVWIDVDRRYFNDVRGPGGYEDIDLQPGYRLLTGRQALDYVRFRHTDSDLYRVARQQQFVKGFKAQVRQSFAPIALPKVVNAMTRNIEVAQGGGKPVDGKTILSYALFAYGLPKGHVYQDRIEGFEGYADLTTNSENVKRAIDAFTHPDVESSEKATAVALGEKLKQRVPAPRQTTITVLNGNGVTGSASTAGYLLGQRSYDVITPPNGLPANAPNFDYFRTQVYFDPSRPKSSAAARKVANLFGSAEIARLPSQLSSLSNGAMLTVVVGQTFHGSLTSAPIDQTPRREKPNVVFAPNAALPHLRGRQQRAGYPIMVPTIIERSSWTDSSAPVRQYKIEGDHRAVRLVYRMGSNEYWGVQMTDWDGAPVLSDKSLTRRIKGRTYDLYYNGSKLHMVVLRTPKASYWVINTLLDRMSNETMLAIAKGLKPISGIKDE
ncbi:MAG TPA: LCP family protein [Gaiellaceae bacterium]|nr:LCP family protein [Gaiellaceae bacterium]